MMIRLKRQTAFLILSMGLMAAAIWAIGLERPSSKMHNFEGQCQLCHEAIPTAGSRFEDALLTDDADQSCVRCHRMETTSSHPTGITPSRTIPFHNYLDKNGQLTCLTCHDVHKEEKSADQRESKGLLRGHVQGREFCFTCHREDILGTTGWRHKLVVTYAHQPGELSQSETGAFLDPGSVECLSCHDGIISKMDAVKVRAGRFEHGIGLSHPVGVDYPQGTGRKNDFTDRMGLPSEIKLFDGKVGCLSCHNAYSEEKNYLVMNNTKSALCLSCHRK